MAVFVLHLFLCFYHHFCRLLIVQLDSDQVSAITHICLSVNSLINKAKRFAIILPTNVFNACLRLFVFVSARSDKSSSRATWLPQRQELQCSLANCLRWSAVKTRLEKSKSRKSPQNNSSIYVDYI